MKTIEILDPSLKLSFIQMPVEVLKMKGLSHSAKIVYGLLLSYAWYNANCFPGQEKLAEDAECSSRTVRKHLKDLKDVGLVDWKMRGLGKTNIYYLLPLPTREDRKERSDQCGTELPRKYTKKEIYKDLRGFLKKTSPQYFDDNLVPYVEMYVDEYFKRTGREHPQIPERIRPKVVDRLNAAILGGSVTEITLDEWSNLLDQWFYHTNMETDYNIMHFISGPIIENRFYERCY